MWHYLGHTHLPPLWKKYTRNVFCQSSSLPLIMRWPGWTMSYLDLSAFRLFIEMTTVQTQNRYIYHWGWAIKKPISTLCAFRELLLKRIVDFWSGCDISFVFPPHSTLSLLYSLWIRTVSLSGMQGFPTKQFHYGGSQSFSQQLVNRNDMFQSLGSTAI